MIVMSAWGGTLQHHAVGFQTCKILETLQV